MFVLEEIKYLYRGFFKISFGVGNYTDDVGERLGRVLLVGRVE